MLSNLLNVTASYSFVAKHLQLVQLGTTIYTVLPGLSAQLPECFALVLVVSGVRRHPTGIDNYG
ncbi:MAG: hypothetical protein ACK2U2_12490, partial [Anaerolineae bacterium]